MNLLKIEKIDGGANISYHAVLQPMFATLVAPNFCEIIVVNDTTGWLSIDVGYTLILQKVFCFSLVDWQALLHSEYVGGRLAVNATAEKYFNDAIYSVYVNHVTSGEVYRITIET